MALSKVFTCAAWLSLFLSTHLQLSMGCMEMQGIGDDITDKYTVDDLSLIPLGSIFGKFLVPLVSGRTPDATKLRETPIQFRFLAYEIISLYNVASYYDDIALEFWARQDIMEHRRRCNVDGETDSQVFELHKSVALAYMASWIVPAIVPEVYDDSVANLEKYGLDPYVCDNGQCDVNNDNDLATPWGIAYAVLQEILNFASTDGWNEDGSLSRDYNKIPFQDWRDENRLYTPVNSPWDLEFTERWQPLLESDGIGFLYNQEHVTPHFGYTAKSFLFTNDEICERSKEFQSDSNNYPDYDYNIEMNLAIERSAELDDTKKMLIEAFDNKNILNTMRNQFIGSSDINILGDNAQRLGIYLMNHLSLYEGGLAVWKEKMDFDRVRPTSIIHDQIPDQLITGYGGVTTDGESYGTQTFYAKDWEPYIRTMPHSEYPSASACVCKAWANAYIAHFEVDEWDVQLPDGSPYTFSAYSSKQEPLSTPENSFTYYFSGFNNVADICAESRLWGGMHFTKSIYAGQTLANGIGERASETITLLLNGEKPDYTPDLYDSTITQRTCYPDTFDSDDDDSSDDR